MVHSGLPLRANTGICFPPAILLAPGLAGACWNPFWVYFWLKSARGRRSKKMAGFFMVKGPIFGHFSPNLDLRRPKCRENYARPRFGPLSGHFFGGEILVPRGKRIGPLLGAQGCFWAFFGHVVLFLQKNKFSNPVCFAVEKYIKMRSF